MPSVARVCRSIYSPAGGGSSGGSVGIGFAIPANMARTIMSQILRYGRVRRAHIGVAVQELTPELTTALRVDPRRGGVIVSDVQSGSAAATAGIAAGDLIVQLGDRRVQSAGDYFARAAVLMVGDTVAVFVLRGGQLRRVNLVLTPATSERLNGRDAALSRT